MQRVSPKASLLTALAPPGLNFTRVYISDAKAWNCSVGVEKSLFKLFVRNKFINDGIAVYSERLSLRLMKFINLYSFIIYLYLCSLPAMVTGGVQQVSWNNLMALDSSPIEVEIVPWHFTSILSISLYTFLHLCHPEWWRWSEYVAEMNGAQGLNLCGSQRATGRQRRRGPCASATRDVLCCMNLIMLQRDWRVNILDTHVRFFHFGSHSSALIIAHSTALLRCFSAQIEDLILRWLDVCGGVQPDPFRGDGVCISFGFWLLTAS